MNTIPTPVGDETPTAPAAILGRAPYDFGAVKVPAIYRDLYADEPFVPNFHRGLNEHPALVPPLNVAVLVEFEDGRFDVAHRRAFDGAWTLGYSDQGRGVCAEPVSWSVMPRTRGVYAKVGAA